jgi:hypothetical protein
LEKEINIDEYDAVTGMSLLHFTCKFGAKQIGHEKEAVQVMNALIEKGMDHYTEIRSFGRFDYVIF